MNDERPAATSPPRGLARWLPGLAALRDYPRAALAGDFAAGIAACVVMIPSVLAYAELIGVPPVVGLYTALAAMAGYALFAARTPVFVGPDATVALLAAAAVVPLAAGDPARTAALAVALALLVGIALIIAARLSAGALADLLSKPVLVGYLNGAALVLIGTQLHKLLGIPLSHDAFVPRIVEAATKLGQAHGPTLALGAALIALLLVLRRAVPWLPGALVACIVATIAARALDLPARGVALLGAVPRGLPHPRCLRSRSPTSRRWCPGRSPPRSWCSPRACCSSAPSLRGSARPSTPTASSTRWASPTWRRPPWGGSPWGRATRAP